VVNNERRDGGKEGGKMREDWRENGQNGGP